MSYSLDDVVSIIKEFKQTASQTDTEALAEQIGQALGQSKTQDALSSDLSTRTSKDDDVGQAEILKVNAALDQALMTMNKKGQADAYLAFTLEGLLEERRQKTAQFEQRLRQDEEMFHQRRVRENNLLTIDTKSLDVQDSATPAK